MVNELAVADWSRVTSERLAEVIAMEASGRLSATQAKQVIAEMVESGGDPARIAQSRGFDPMGGDDLHIVVEDVISGHPDEWRRFCSGDPVDRKKMTGFFTGRVMRATRGRADGAVVSRLLRERAA